MNAEGHLCGAIHQEHTSAPVSDHYCRFNSFNDSTKGVEREHRGEQAVCSRRGYHPTTHPLCHPTPAEWQKFSRCVLSSSHPGLGLSMVNTFHLHNSGNSIDICEFTFNLAFF